MAGTLTAEAVVTALYRGLLLREPDLPGLAAHAAALGEGATTLEAMIGSFLQSAEFRARAPILLRESLASGLARFTNDHSQFGEFLIWLRQFVNAAARHRIVVAVGANGRERSNSYDLLREFGWRGLLIEANPALVAGIGRDFAGLDYTLVAAAIADFEGTAALHLGVNADVSSLREANTRAWGATTGAVMVRVRRLPEILAEHAIPRDFDLLSLDIEGEDVAVLNDTMAAGYRPRWVIIEANHDAVNPTLTALPVSDAVVANYAIVGQTAPNLILQWRGK